MKLVKVEVEDRSFLEEFDFFGFVDGNALMSFVTVGVLVQGDVLGGFAFPRYQCNESSISEGRGRIGKVWSEEDTII